MDVDKMMDTKDKVVTGLTSGIEYLFSKNKVTYVKGTGRITGPKEVSVALTGGGEQKIATENILIATGSDVMSLPGIEIDEERIVSSTGALSLKEVPKKMVVIGGGVIGLELGSVWARLGAEVTVVEFLPEIAAGADKTIAKKFQKVLQRQGIKFQLSTKVISATNTGNQVKLTVESAKGGAAKELDADVVLVAVGRRPYTDSLGLAEVGVKVSERGVVETDEHFRTNVPSIRAIGDVVKGPMLAHKAEEEGIAAVENIINQKAGHVNYDAIPSVIYTNPEVYVGWWTVDGGWWVVLHVNWCWLCLAVWPFLFFFPPHVSLCACLCGCISVRTFLCVCGVCVCVCVCVCVHFSCWYALLALG
jgi:dihydrolipoyl dehydrogenase